MRQTPLRSGLIALAALTIGSCSDDSGFTQPATTALYTTPTGLVTANPPQVIAGAGDISKCTNDNDEATAKLLDAIPGVVFTLGDNVMPNGTSSEFASCYAPTWGRHKARTRPAAGNHDYNTSGAAGYFAYFGAAAGEPGKGWYSYELGAWHVVVLNSNLPSTSGSAQDTWLKADLAAHPNQCTLAYFHQPLYSSTGGSGTGGATLSGSRNLVNDLYAGHADVIMNGHRHFYERLAPMKPDGTADPVNGVREFISGTGGDGGGTLTNIFPLSEARNGNTFGVLKLWLYDDSYAWKFVPVAGKTFTDSGSTACHVSGGGGGGVSATNSTVSAAPTAFTAGSGSATITVTARDANGGTISGAAVTVTASGSGNSLAPATGTTDGGGVFTSTFTTTVAEGKTISANINGTALTQTASVTVNAPSGGGGNGVIAPALLTSGGSGVNQRVYTTASIAPAANALITVAIRMHRSSGALTPALSGGGMTSWTQVASVDYDPVATPTSRLVVFRAMSGTPGTGPLTISFTNNISNVEWVVSQWTGVDQSGGNGSGAIGQTGSASGNAVTSLSKVLTPFGSASNAALGVLGAGTSASAAAPGAGFMEIAEATSGESTLLEAEWGANRNAVAATLSKAANAGLLAIELVAAEGGGPGDPPDAGTSSVSAAPSSIVAGSGTSVVTVTVRDASGTPVDGAAVSLSTSGTHVSFGTLSGSTNSSGVFTSTLSSTDPQQLTVWASAGGVAIAQSATVTVTPQGGGGGRGRGRHDRADVAHLGPRPQQPAGLHDGVDRAGRQRAGDGRGADAPIGGGGAESYAHGWGDGGLGGGGERQLQRRYSARPADDLPRDESRARQRADHHHLECYGLQLPVDRVAMDRRRRIRRERRGRDWADEHGHGQRGQRADRDARRVRQRQQRRLRRVRRRQRHGRRDGGEWICDHRSAAVRRGDDGRPVRRVGAEPERRHRGLDGEERGRGGGGDQGEARNVVLPLTYVPGAVSVVLEGAAGRREGRAWFRTGRSA